MTGKPGNIKIEEYNYSLPEERIAETPLEPRDSSKLLVYKGGNISVDTYSHRFPLLQIFSKCEVSPLY